MNLDWNTKGVMALLVVAKRLALAVKSELQLLPDGQ